MSDGRIDLLPPVFGARARLRLLNRRIVAILVIMAVALVTLVFHARIRRANAEGRLVDARQRAEEVLQAEQREESLLMELQSSRDRIEAWRQVALPLPVGGVLVTMANLLPDKIVLEELQIDVSGLRVDTRRSTEGGRRLMGRLEGHASDEAMVRAFVVSLRDRVPFEEVRRGFTALVEIDGEVLTRFSVDFEVDLDAPWRAEQVEELRVDAAGGTP